MKKIMLLVLFIFSIKNYIFSQKQDIELVIQLSNPINSTNVGWFNIDSESVDEHNVKNKSFATGILFNLKKNSNWRARLQFTQIDLREYKLENGSSINTTGKQLNYDIAPGISWNLVTENKKISPYMGFEFPVSFKGEYILTIKSMTNQTNPEEIYIKSERTINIPKGYTIGINGLIGFKYSFYSKFSVCAEFSSGLLYSKLGGTIIEDYLFENLLLGETVKESTTFEDKTEGITFSENRFSLGIGIAF